MLTAQSCTAWYAWHMQDWRARSPRSSRRPTAAVGALTTGSGGGGSGASSSSALGNEASIVQGSHLTCSRALAARGSTGTRSVGTAVSHFVSQASKSKLSHPEHGPTNSIHLQIVYQQARWITINQLSQGAGMQLRISLLQQAAASHARQWRRRLRCVIVIICAQRFTLDTEDRA